MRAPVLVIALALALALAGCGSGAGDRVAGAGLDEGGFGNPTLANRLAMTGEGGYALALDRRFAAAVPHVVTFPFDSAALTAEAQAALDRQAAFMRQFPEVRFSVYGHADLVGGEAYNRRLGRARARAVVAYLAGRGVSPGRLDALVSYGESRPAVPVAGPERRNRRAVTEVAGFVRSHPTILDGKYAQVVYREYVLSALPPPGVVGVAAGTPIE
jgi:outer membrane protein OmpA-like peptidoglycan-associated protein